MAGDWIKVREDIHEDPAVIAMALRLDERPETVVGFCVRFWSWVSRQCHAGSVTNVTLVSLERLLNVPGFLHALCDVGWLEYRDDEGQPVIEIPKFERHLSQGAKARALAAERKRSQRTQCHAPVTKVSRSQRDESVTREEKRREECITTLTSSNTAAKSKQPTVEDVRAYCEERGNRVDPQAWFDHYQSNGWMVGKVPMKDWKAAVRTWERSSFARKAPQDELAGYLASE